MINYVGNIFKESKSISIDIELRTAKNKVSQREHYKSNMFIKCSLMKKQGAPVTQAAEVDGKRPQELLGGGQNFFNSFSNLEIFFICCL